MRDVFLHFLEEEDQIAAGSAGFAMRLGWFCCAAMSLKTYTALVRGEERAILDPHPGNPALLLRYLTVRCGVESLGLLLCAVAMLWPILWAGHVGAFWAGSLVVFVGWLLGLLVGFPVHLGAVWAAESKGLSGIMEALRGANPRLQAALIYAPGIVLALGGLGVWSASVGAEIWLTGIDSAWAWMVAPLCIAAGAVLLSTPLAIGFHYRTTALLSEIDGYYARLEDPEEARLVYLQWAIRPFPGAWQPYLLQELRHGWRSLRSWITGAWAIGLLAAISATGSEVAAFERSLALTGGGMVLIAGVGLRLAISDPEWLEQVLPLQRSLRRRARFTVLFLWLQGVILLVPLALWWRHGASDAALLFATLEAFALVLSALATQASQWRTRGWAAYIPAAVLLWAASLGALT